MNKGNEITLRSLIATLAFACATCFGATLNFDSPRPGTILDSNGLGVGFTHRLPGTGFDLPASDPNMNLQSQPGRLALRSTHTDLNHFPGNTPPLGIFEAPGLYLQNILGQNISMSALFRNVRVPNGSDQLMIYAGTTSSNVLRSGVHNQNIFTFTGNQGTGDQNTLLSPLGAFADGDDLRLTLSRIKGEWQLAWTNLTNPQASGAGPKIPVPWLDGESNLYVGVLAANPGTQTPFVGEVDSFSASVLVPVLNIEVACLALNWQTQMGETYQLQYATTLSPTNWIDLGSPVQGTGTNTVFTDSILGQPRRFYRLLLAP